MAQQADIFEFYHSDIEPIVFPSIGAMFSEFTIERHGRPLKRWESPYKLDGVTPSHDGRQDKTYIEDPRRKGKQHIRVKEQGGENIDLIEFVMRRQKLSNIDAVKWLAKQVGREEDIPKGTPEDEARYKKHKEKQQRLEAALQQMKDALFTPEAEAVLKHLKGTDEEKNERAYTEDYIRELPVGFLSASMPCYKELRDSLLHYYDSFSGDEKGLCEYSFTKRNEETGKWEGVGTGYTHTLAIAIYADGEIKGFKFRTILSKKELQDLKDRLSLRKTPPKYLAAFTGEKDTQDYFTTSLPSGKLTAYGDKYLNFTLVEGELDTYRGIAAGLKNVTGLSQGDLTQNQLEKLKKRGAKSITILKDTEDELTETGEPNTKNIQENKEAAARAVRLIASHGLTPYVLYLPSTDGKKVDLDKYFRGLDGDELQAKGEQLQALIDSAEGGFTFLFSLLAETHTEKTEKEIRLFKREALQLISQEGCDAVAREEICRRFAEATGHSLTAEDILSTLNDTLAEQEALKTAQNALQARLKNASEQLYTDPEKTLQTLKTAVSEYEASAKTTDLKAKYRTIETAEQRHRRRAGQKKGLATNYTFLSKTNSETPEQEQLLLPSGAITYVCFPTSHGKTRLLENLALQLALSDESEGSVLFFSVEEDEDAVKDQLLNIYHALRLYNEPKTIRAKGEFETEVRKSQLSENNLRTIRSYYAEADPMRKGNYVKGRLTSNEHKQLYNDFLESEQKFYADLIDSERLKVSYEESRNADKIIEGINFLWKDLQTESQPRPIKAVFIDYIQRLHKTGDFKGSRKEELTAVTNDLMTLSINLGVPFVIAVQLNREALSPIEIDLQNIADAAEIEQSGNLVLLGWNSSFAPRIKSTWYYKDSKDKKKKESEDAEKFRNRTGINLGEGHEGDLYLMTAKNRSGQRNFESRLYFDGNSGLILQGERFTEFYKRTAQKPTQPGTQPGTQAQPTQEEIKKEEEEKTRAALNALNGKQKKAEPTQPTPEDDDPLGGGTRPESDLTF